MTDLQEKYDIQGPNQFLVELEEKFDVLPEETPGEDYPDFQDMVLWCREDGCGRTTRLPQDTRREETDWDFGLSGEAVLKNGDTVHPARCPEHADPDETMFLPTR